MKRYPTPHEVCCLFSQAYLREKSRARSINAERSFLDLLECEKFAAAIIHSVCGWLYGFGIVHVAVVTVKGP